MMHISMIFDPDACICDAGFFPDQPTDEQGDSRSWIPSLFKLPSPSVKLYVINYEIKSLHFMWF